MLEHHRTDRTVIVVGTSGSPASRASVHRAALSLRATGGVLHLVHAYDRAASSAGVRRWRSSIVLRRVTATRTCP